MDAAEQCIRNRLEEMRDEITALSDATRDERDPVVVDQQSVGRLARMDALQSQAMQIETERWRQVALARIEAALARLDHGEFGYCIVCGEAIEDRRLANDPTVPTCIRCAGG
jgi:DnaK suppressor protein